MKDRDWRSERLDLEKKNKKLMESEIYTVSNHDIGSDNIKLLSVRDFDGLVFSIGNYQRGYKWEKKEILELLNDINDYNGEGFYCLQPLIIFPVGDDKKKVVCDQQLHNDFEVHRVNEIIDGQQRTTTLYIIWQFLKNKKNVTHELCFQVDYATRKKSGDFLLTALIDFLQNFTFELSDEQITAEKYDDYSELNILWDRYVEQFPEYDNVDIYHFFVVAATMIKWFEVFGRENGDVNNFVEKLTDSVKVIWYELSKNDRNNQKEEIIKVFQNNNKNKIKLTNSELIKALFILQIKQKHNKEIAEFEINKFAMEWDMIENQLQDKSFWYFVCKNKEDYHEGTHIDLIFDLLQLRTKSDDFYSYRKYEKQFNNGEDLDWQEVLELYYKLVDWYNDKEFYHYIGFLINTGVSSLQKIREKSHQKKNAFLDDLKEMIKKEFKKSKDDKLIYHLENLDYEDKNSVKNVLLLFNVLYYCNNHSDHKFPFELYVEEQWSIEHINPQNPRELDDLESYKNWFFEKIEDDTEENNKKLKTELTVIFADPNFDRTKKNMRLEEIENELTKFSKTHKIENLALLDRNTNSSLGNNLFNKKREKILLFDVIGKASVNGEMLPVFIPQETKNVFSKIYSETESLKENRWSKKDGERYREVIFERLKEFYQY